MSVYKFDTDYLEVDDEFEGGPIEQSYFISAVMAAGGEIEVDGNVVRILSLPKAKETKAKAVVASKVEEVPKAPVVKAPEALKAKAPEVPKFQAKPKVAPPVEKKVN